MASEKGLGRGLGALLGEASQSAAVDCVYLPIGKVESCDGQPRKYFDEDALTELAGSISQHGIIQPLTVRKLHSGNYQIIAGERRWRAARIAGLDTVPARIMEVDDRTAAQLALVENLQREDLNPIEEARGLQSLIDDFQLTQEQAAESVGKSRPAVTNALRLLSLPDEVQLELEQGRISTGHAKVILSLREPRQQLALLKSIIADRLSVRETEQEAKTIANQVSDDDVSVALPDPVAKGFRMYLNAIEKNLEGEIGRKVRISGDGSVGKLTLEYYSRDDLDALVRSLGSSGTE
ncbi:MAG: ParB/RepB/Spo0J family partition protein [Oscillospiraceae bacterium]|jgi:ParB family chromosome partitioning protein|nr:ParB/RepB/Spo0J family partition protein [Oscillospiraceae bacterium]